MNRLAVLGILALVAIIMLTPQSASANWIGGFNCFREPRCVSGWNHAIIQAQTDWNSGQYTKIRNGGNPDCFVGQREKNTVMDIQRDIRMRYTGSVNLQ
jgi:hypothetical protein